MLSLFHFPQQTTTILLWMPRKIAAIYRGAAFAATDDDSKTKQKHRHQTCSNVLEFQLFAGKINLLIDFLEK